MLCCGCNAGVYDDKTGPLNPPTLCCAVLPCPVGGLCGVIDPWDEVKRGYLAVRQGLKKLQIREMQCMGSQEISWMMHHVGQPAHGDQHSTRPSIALEPEHLTLQAPGTLSIGWLSTAPLMNGIRLVPLPSARRVHL